MSAKVAIAVYVCILCCSEKSTVTLYSFVCWNISPKVSWCFVIPHFKFYTALLLRFIMVSDLP